MSCHGAFDDQNVEFTLKQLSTCYIERHRIGEVGCVLMAVPQHIIKFAEKSMEQAALTTFARNLSLAGSRFLSANRDTGMKNYLQ